VMVDDREAEDVHPVVVVGGEPRRGVVATDHRADVVEAAVAMLAAASAGLEVSEYSPLTIKSSVVGYGRAEKQQVQHMVTRLLELAEPPETLDASDALAIAICHLHTLATLERQRAVAR